MKYIITLFDIAARWFVLVGWITILKLKKLFV